MNRILRLIRSATLLVFLVAGVPAAADAPAPADHFRAGRWAEAAAAWREALPGLEGAAAATAQINLGRALENLGQEAEALAAWRGVETLPGARGIDIYNARERAGRLLLGQGEYRAAAELFAGTIARVTAVTGSTAGIGWAREERIASLAAHAGHLEAVPDGFWIDPYVSFVTDTTAVVFWVTRGVTPAGEVSVETAEGDSVVFAAGREELGHAPGFFIHRADLEDLAPRAVQRYRVVLDSRRPVREGSFRTAPAPGTAAPVTFCVYGDTQNRPGFHRQVSEAIARDEPDFVLHTGDMVGPGSEWWAWKTEFFDPAGPWLAGAPVYPTVGNHDGHMFYDPLFRGGGQLHHTFTWGNVQVFILPSYRGGSPGSDARVERVRWLEAELAASGADWRVVVTHYPMISESPAHWNNWGREDFLPVMEKHGVDLVFTGHQHYYRRFLPLGEPGKNPVFHITSGGGASVLGDHGHDGSGPSIPPSPLLVSGARALHHLHVRADGRRLVLEARLRDGSRLDRLVLEKDEAGAYGPAIAEAAVETGLAADIAGLYRRLGEAAARLELPPADGGEGRIVFAGVTLPPDSRLLVAAAAGDGWSVPEQAAAAAGEGLAVRFHAGEGFAPSRLRPSLAVTLEVAGRRFAAGVIAPGPFRGPAPPAE